LQTVLKSEPSTAGVRLTAGASRWPAAPAGAATSRAAGQGRAGDEASKGQGTAIPPVAPALQNNLGVLAGDAAGYPNGRRPGDDVIDNSLRVLMGATLPLELAPSGQLGWTDGVWVDATQFQSAFPYLNDPVPGAD